MPDDNKYQALRAVGYRIPVACGLCIHGKFPARERWGTCGANRYYHLKHNNPDGGRGVSIVREGTCDNAKLDPAKASLLGAHREFLD
jgi:hypothetical protein